MGLPPGSAEMAARGYHKVFAPTAARTSGGGMVDNPHFGITSDLPVIGEETAIRFSQRRVVIARAEDQLLPYCQETTTAIVRPFSQFLPLLSLTRALRSLAFSSRSLFRYRLRVRLQSPRLP